MFSTTPNTALILFTRTLQEEIAHKKILRSKKARSQKQIFKFLIQHTRQLGEQSGLSFFEVNSDNQQGKTFGERLENIFAQYFALGFAKVIVIGNDCAQLKAVDILNAAQQLQSNKAVFGAAQDGGVYLLGLDQDLLTNKTGFTQINWQTKSVLSELLTWCGNSIAYVLPEVYADLDYPNDVRSSFFTKQLPDKLFTWLVEFFSPVIYVLTPFTFLILNQFSPSYCFRGPPVR